jgi:four helix bundle protein
MAEVKKSRSYRELKVRERAIDLIKDIYEATSHFPPVEKLALAQQMETTVSVSSHIAEGQFRNSPKEFKQFLSIALGPSAELELQLIIANKISYLSIYNILHY